MKRLICFIGSLLVLSASAQAQTSTLPISSLPTAATPLMGSEYVPVVQSGATRKAHASDITGILAGLPSVVTRNDTPSTFTAQKIFSVVPRLALTGYVKGNGIGADPTGSATIPVADLAAGSGVVSALGNGVGTSGGLLVIGAVNGADLSALSFSGCAFKYSGFCVAQPISAPIADGYGAQFNNTSLTGQTIYSGILPPTYYLYDTIRAVAESTPSTTVQGVQAVAAYARASVAQGIAPNQKNAVALLGLAQNAVNGSAVWAQNLICNDNTSNGLATLFGRICVIDENDIEVNGASTIEGVVMIIQGPGTPLGATAFHVSRSGGAVAQWSYGHVIDNGAAAVAFINGALTTSGSNVASQPVQLRYFDSGGLNRAMQLQAVNDAILLSAAHLANYFYAASAATGGTPFFGCGGTDANINCNVEAKGSGTLRLNATATGPVSAEHALFAKNSAAAGVAFQIWANGSGTPYAQLSAMNGVGSVEFGSIFWTSTFGNFNAGGKNVQLSAAAFSSAASGDLTLGASATPWSSVYANAYYAGATAGASCSAGTLNTATAVVSGGIVTQC